ncbi:ATP-binding protein [Kribbella sp. NPDC055110]
MQTGEAGAARWEGEARASMVGRQAELDQLDSMVDRIGTRGGSLLIRGEAGVGKSTLLQAVRERARERGATVVTATGVASESRLAFGALHQLLLPFLGSDLNLPPRQRRALDVALGIADGETPDIYLVGLATLGVLTDRAATAPLLVVVDDAHWLDGPTAEVLAFVARRLDMEVVLLVLAIREGLRPELENVGLPELHLGGLDPDAARNLLDRTGRGLSPELRDRILKDAAGNPLALIELPIVSATLQQTSSWVPLPLTARLESAFASRLFALSADSRALLLLAALDGADVNLLTRAAEDLLRRSVDQDAWATTVTTGLGSLDRGRFRFRHPLMRSAVHQVATADERRHGHAALARVLAGDPDRAIWHRADASAGTDDGIADGLVEASDRARARGGIDVAVAALERAASLTTDPGLRAIRLKHAGYLEFDRGEASHSLDMLRRALTLGLPEADAASAAFLLETMSSAWTASSAVPRFTQIAQDLAYRGDDREALLVLDDVSLRAHWGPLDDETRHQVSAVVAGLAVPADDPIRLSCLGLIDPVGRAAEVVQGLRRLTPLNLVDPTALMAVGQAAAAVWADDLGLPFLRLAVDGFRADGRLGKLGQALIHQAWGDVHAGSAGLALTGAAEGVRLAHEVRQPRYAAVGTIAHAIAAGASGDARTAERLASSAEAVLMPTGAHQLLALVALARGRAALAQELPDEAFASLARIFRPTDVAYQPFVRGWALADLAEAAVHGRGDLGFVHECLAEWHPIAARAGSGHLVVQIAYADAVLAAEENPGDPEDQFAIAIAISARGWPFYSARTQLAKGEWLRRQHRDVDARDPLRTAAEVFEALGQRRYAERAVRELRATGERPRQRTPENWTQLSPQELQIAQLAATGLSNREIGQRLYLSHRTIGTHLYNTFPKLGITSRAQLRDVLPAIDDPGQASHLT